MIKATFNEFSDGMSPLALLKMYGHYIRTATTSNEVRDVIDDLQQERQHGMVPFSKSLRVHFQARRKLKMLDLAEAA